MAEETKAADQKFSVLSKPSIERTPEEIEQEKAAKAKKAAQKKNAYLLNAKTEAYADDSSLYNPRINLKDRKKYIDAMMAQTSRRQPPKTHVTYQDTWMHGDYDYEGDTYPSIFVWVFALLKTNAWDYLYLTLLLLYLLILCAAHDASANLSGFDNMTPFNGTEIILYDDDLKATEATVEENLKAMGLDSTTVILPIIFMLLSQAPPFIGCFYFVNRCNDLVKYKAKSGFGQWAFVGIFICQAVENFWYGGRSRSHAAGKCAYGKTMMKYLGKTKVDLSGLNDRSNMEPESDDDENAFAQDDFPEGHKTIQQRIEEARLYAYEHPDDEEAQQLCLGELEMSSLGRKIEDKNRKEVEEKARRKAEEEAREAACEDWTEWTCLVCNHFNRRPTHPVKHNEVYFGTKGTFYKRTFAIIRPRRDAPQCTYCMTFSDYLPPESSAHTFPHNKQPYRAFANYPIKTSIHAGLHPGWFSQLKNSCLSFWCGLKNNSNSLLVYNDWKLKQYLNGRFPETPRQTKPRDGLYMVGEWVECKLQKVDWCRCVVIKARENHVYDIRYDYGDELRLVREIELRLPPEKRTYAYMVELVMCFIVMATPVAIMAAALITPALIFFHTFIGCGYLCILRVMKLAAHFRTFKYAGFWVVFKLSMFFLLPLLLICFGSLMPMAGAPWMITAYFWIGGMVTSLPILYIMKPHFAVFAGGAFVLASAGFYMIAQWLDGNRMNDLFTAHCAPFIMLNLLLIYYRGKLDTFVDVTMTVRPPLNFIPPDAICTRIINLLLCRREVEKVTPDGGVEV